MKQTTSIQNFQNLGSSMDTAFPTFNNNSLLLQQNPNYQFPKQQISPIEQNNSAAKNLNNSLFKFNQLTQPLNQNSEIYSSSGQSQFAQSMSSANFGGNPQPVGNNSFL